MASKIASTFVAYSTFPSAVEPVIVKAIASASPNCNGRLVSWREEERLGAFISTTVRAQIDQSQIFVADVTETNLNVIFEIGYAIGRGKRILLVRNDGIGRVNPHAADHQLFRNVVCIPYKDSAELAKVFESAASSAQAVPYISAIDLDGPLFVVAPDVPTTLADAAQAELSNQLSFRFVEIGRTRRYNIRTRIYSRSEQGILTAEEAVREVSRSVGVFAILQPHNTSRCIENNIRVSFISGIALGMSKQLFIVQEEGGPAPLDFHDFAITPKSEKHAAQLISKFVDDFVETYARFYRAREEEQHHRASVTERLVTTFSNVIAENEKYNLKKFYVRTDAYQRAHDLNGRLVVGRKGAGKTALFQILQMRWQEADKDGVCVIEIAPPETQMARFKEAVATIGELSNRLTLTQLFWEFVISVEMCRETISFERNRPLSNMTYLPAVRALESSMAVLFPGADVSQADFSIRLAQSVRAVTEGISMFADDGLAIVNQAIRILRGPEILAIKEALLGYYREAGRACRVLVDNVDKAFNPDTLDDVDIAMVRGLVTASKSIEGYYAKGRGDFGILVFLRDDVYQQLVVKTPDRGKEFIISVDWRDEQVFEQLVLRRLVAAGLKGDSFQKAWALIASPTVAGESSWRFVLERSMMRPRFLIHMIRACMSSAFVNGQREKIGELDFLAGEREHSGYVLDQIGLELVDTVGIGETDLRSIFAASERVLSFDTLASTLSTSNVLQGNINPEVMIEKLVWFGCLGLVQDGKELYIWDYGFDHKTMYAMWRGARREGVTFAINKALCSQLRVRY